MNQMENYIVYGSGHLQLCRAQHYRSGLHCNAGDPSVKGKGRQLARSNVEGEYLDGCELIHDQCVATIN